MNFRLSASLLDFYVDVHLYSFEERWLAVAEIADEREIGFGRTATEALAASLSSLGSRTADALMADPQLTGFGQVLT